MATESAQGRGRVWVTVPEALKKSVVGNCVVVVAERVEISPRR